jgi:hypothetical protein
MIHEVIVASAQVLVDFKKQMRGLWKVYVFFSDHIVNDDEPGVEQIRNAWLHDLGLRNDCDSCRCLGVSVILPVSASVSGPSSGLV